MPCSILGRGSCQIHLNWSTRLKICIGIARGLAFLHEESRLKIVHRDIKATNVLLDGDLNPKISDFGLARLDEEEKTHVSTRIAGTMYALSNYSSFGSCFVTSHFIRYDHPPNFSPEAIWHRNMLCGAT